MIQLSANTDVESVSIFNTLGQKVSFVVTDILGSDGFLDLGELPVAVYVLTVTAGKVQWSMRLVVSK
jgi:hypothetical protein